LKGSGNRPATGSDETGRAAPSSRRSVIGDMARYQPRDHFTPIVVATAPARQ